MASADAGGQPDAGSDEIRYTQADFTAALPSKDPGLTSYRIPHIIKSHIHLMKMVIRFKQSL